MSLASLAPNAAELRTATNNLAAKWLCGWGAVERERAATGDPSAVPMGSWEVRGGARGAQSGLPGILEVWADVEMTLGTKRPLLRLALLHKYRDGVDERCLEVSYVLRDGTTTDPRPLDAAPPAHYVSASPRTARSWTFDFAGPSFRRLIGEERWRLTGATMSGSGRRMGWLFESLVRDFERELARERGLKSLAASYLEKGVGVL